LLLQEMHGKRPLLLLEELLEIALISLLRWWWLLPLTCAVQRRIIC
jgi:hypothetical protein